MRALITGGSGFIGSHLADALVARDDEVSVVDNFFTGKRENLADAIAGGAELHVEDITDERAMARVLDETRPEVVFHLAAQPHVTRSVNDPVFDLRSNVEGTIKLLEMARGPHPFKIAFASTGGAIYGEGEGRDLPLDEDAECVPYSPYAQSKMAAELYLELYRRLYGVESVALRLANIYGPRQDPYGEAGVIAIFSAALHEGRQPTVFGPGSRPATTRTSPTSSAGLRRRRRLRGGGDVQRRHGRRDNGPGAGRAARAALRHLLRAQFRAVATWRGAADLALAGACQGGARLVATARSPGRADGNGRLVRGPGRIARREQLP